MDFEKNEYLSKRVKRRQILDAFFVIFFTVVVYLCASRHDVLERLVEFTARHEAWEFDEIITVSIFLVFALLFFAFRRWLEIRQANNALHDKNKELRKAISEIKRLRGILPICAQCKRIRDDAGYWHQVELYVREHTDAEFSHSICPDCMRKLYPEFISDEDNSEAC